MKKSRANDGKTIIESLFMTIAPSDATKAPSGQTNGKLATKFGLKPKTLRRYMKEGIRNRKKALDSVAQVGIKNTQLTQVYKRKSRTTFTPEYIVRLHDWIENHSELITTSPKIDDTVWVTNPVTKVKERKQKMFYVSCVRELHNQSI